MWDLAVSRVGGCCVFQIELWISAHINVCVGEISLIAMEPCAYKEINIIENGRLRDKILNRALLSEKLLSFFSFWG